MIDCIEVYSTFNAIKLHFSGSFDVRKYGFHLKKYNGESLFKSHLEYTCRKLADRYQTSEECRTIFAANLVRDPSMHMTKVDDELGKRLKKYNRNKHALVEDIVAEIDRDLFTKIKNGDIISELYKDSISIELLAFTNRFIPIISLIDTEHGNEYAWKMMKPRVEKLSPFCLLNSTDQRDTIRDHLLTVIQNKHNRNN